MALDDNVATIAAVTMVTIQPGGEKQWKSQYIALWQSWLAPKCKTSLTCYDKRAS